jgi:hypothetical protein
VGEIDAGLFEDLAIAQDASLAATAFGALPAILSERRAAIRLFELRADAILQLPQIDQHGVDVGTAF